MADRSVSRRDVLLGAGAGIGTLAIGASGAGATERIEYNVGISSPAGERAARQAADRVRRTLDWGNGRKTITLSLTDDAVQGLWNRSGIRYVERNGRMHAVAQTLPWGVDRVDTEKVHDDGETGGDNADGDLVSVTSEMLVTSGVVLDSDGSSPTGSSASGTHYVESKSSGSEIRLTVADDAGDTTTSTKSI